MARYSDKTRQKYELVRDYDTELLHALVNSRFMTKISKYKNLFLLCFFLAHINMRYFLIKTLFPYKPNYVCARI